MTCAGFSLTERFFVDRSCFVELYIKSVFTIERGSSRPTI